MNKKAERINHLVDVIKMRGYVNIKELTGLLDVSEMTVRRDLKILEANRIVENVSGTQVYNPAHLVSRSDGEYSLLKEELKQDKQKESIGQFAASLVVPGDTVIIDTGTTTEKIVPFLPDNQDITVLCYNINILMELRRKIGVRMMLAGGYYHQNTQMFECAQGADFIRGVRAGKVFVSAAGVHNTLGLTCANGYEVATKKAIISSSLQRILVVDSSKFDRLGPAYFCDLSEIHTIVTDNGLSDEWKQHIQERQIELHVI